jgi:hypothetical protein
MHVAVYWYVEAVEACMQEHQALNLAAIACLPWTRSAAAAAAAVLRACCLLASGSALRNVREWMLGVQGAAWNPTSCRAQLAFVVGLNVSASSAELGLFVLGFLRQKATGRRTSGSSSDRVDISWCTHCDSPASAVEELLSASLSHVSIAQPACAFSTLSKQLNLWISDCLHRVLLPLQRSTSAPRFE